VRVGSRIIARRYTYGWVRAIREQIKNGVDQIKLNLSGGTRSRSGQMA